MRHGGLAKLKEEPFADHKVVGEPAPETDTESGHVEIKSFGGWNKVAGPNFQNAYPKY